jgi:hypothetical protein
MSIWINRALALAMLGAALVACAELHLPTLGPRKIDVLGGAVAIVPPPGYCPAPQASTVSGDTAVVLMGRCQAQSGAAPAILTASIGAADSAAVLEQGPIALTRFFTSKDGRAMLASTGRPQDVAVLAAEQDATRILLQIKDRDLGTYWRGIFALRGRLVMLSATGVDAATLPPDTGRALLARAIAALQQANARPAKTFFQPAPRQARPAPRAKA